MFILWSIPDPKNWTSVTRVTQDGMVTARIEPCMIVCFESPSLLIGAFIFVTSKWNRWWLRKPASFGIFLRQFDFFLYNNTLHCKNSLDLFFFCDVSREVEGESAASCLCADMTYVSILSIRYDMTTLFKQGISISLFMIINWLQYLAS